MISFQTHRFKNGLRLVHHHDAVVVGVRHVDVAFFVHRHVAGGIEGLRRGPADMIDDVRQGATGVVHAEKANDLDLVGEGFARHAGG